MDDRQEHRESLEEEATHATDEARMVLPGTQAADQRRKLPPLIDRVHVPTPRPGAFVKKRKRIKRNKRNK